MNRTSSLLLATAALVGAANVGAYAASGSPLLGGKPNLTTGMTTIHRTKPGPALFLKVRPGSAPLAVSSSKKVVRLDADQLDGLDSSVLRTRAYTYTLKEPALVSQFSAVFPKLPTGTYQMSFAITLDTVSTTAKPIICVAYGDKAGTQDIAFDYGSHDLGTQYSSTSATVVHHFTGGARLSCLARDVNETFRVQDISTVSFVRIDSDQVQAAQVTTARP